MFVNKVIGQRKAAALERRTASINRPPHSDYLRNLAVFALLSFTAVAGYAQSTALPSTPATSPASRGHSHELIQNGDFEQTLSSTNDLPAWTLVTAGNAEGELARESTAPLDEHTPHSLRLTVRSPGNGFGVANSNARGMNVAAGEWYDLSFYARTETNAHFALTVSLESRTDGKVCARATIPEVGGTWKQYVLPLHARQSATNARTVIVMVDPGTIWFDNVSLVPRKEAARATNGAADPGGWASTR